MQEHDSDSSTEKMIKTLSVKHNEPSDSNLLDSSSSIEINNKINTPFEIKLNTGNTINKDLQSDSESGPNINQSQVLNKAFDNQLIKSSLHSSGSDLDISSNLNNHIQKDPHPVKQDLSSSDEDLKMKMKALNINIEPSAANNQILSLSDSENNIDMKPLLMTNK